MHLETEQVTALWQVLFARLGLTVDDITPALSHVVSAEYRPKTPIIQSGDRWRKLYFVQRGLIRMFYTDQKGRDFNKAFFVENQAVWPVAPINRTSPIRFNIATIEATTLWECPIEPIETLLRRHNLWAAFALPFAEKLIETKFQREHDFLMLSATERFEQFCMQFPHLLPRLPDYHLASMLGITNVTLSRIRSATTTHGQFL